MIKMKKAQAAMEFLMTYGWTILVILMAGAALVYFDVLNPGKFLPDNCNVQSFSCTDFKVTATSASIYLTNNVGDDITVTGIELDGGAGTYTQSVQIGKSFLFTFSGTFGDAGDRYKSTMKVSYSTQTSGISHTNAGEIATTIE